MSSQKCPECGSVNPSNAVHCAICRTHLRSGPDVAAGESDVDPTSAEEELGGDAGWRAAVLDSAAAPALSGPAGLPVPMLVLAGVAVLALVVLAVLGLRDGAAESPEAEPPGQEPTSFPTEIYPTEIYPTETPKDPLPTSSEPSPSPTPITSVGLVTTDETATDPRAAGVAAAFNTYFTSINSGDYRTAAALFDPAGKVLDPGNAKAVEAFGKSLSTTQDSDVVLRAVTDAAAPAAVAAEVTFRSNQQPGYGPKGREDETCTLWSIRYELSSDAGGGYRILRAKAEPSRPCAS